MTAHRISQVALAFCFVTTLVAANVTASSRQTTSNAPLPHDAAAARWNASRGGRPSVRTPFPEIKNWNSLVIGLERSACYGTCPVYRVEIHGDGTVVFVGERFVAVTGESQERVPLSTVRQLFAQFRSADYFWSFDRYAANATDLPVYATSIAFDGQSKSIVDYAGRMIGMPSELIALEDDIDRAANTGKWIKAAGSQPDR